MNAVKVLKLITGEEVVATIMDASSATVLTEQISSQGHSNTITIQKPMVIQIQPIGQGQVGLVLIPWSLANQHLPYVEIKASSVVAEPFDPAVEVERQYLEQTSGIKLM